MDMSFIYILFRMINWSYIVQHFVVCPHQPIHMQLLRLHKLLLMIKWSYLVQNFVVSSPSAHPHTTF